ncbi:MAG: FAD-binding oxidoreductase [Minwuiales bacterium]|nr:FAD-binding oxidoreductase [Minwuiales bacterium]
MAQPPRIDTPKPSLPRSADIVVIGAGIVGISTALFLARRGLSVLVCEKGRIAGEQSSRNWGWCRKMGRDPVEIPLAIASARLWEGMNTLVEGETGFRKTGIIYLCKNDDETAKYEAWLGHARCHDLDSRLVSANEVSALLPGLTGRWPGALFTPSDGRAEPSLATAAMAKAAQRSGARIVERCAVRGVEKTAGAISAVVTEHGTVSTRTVVLAGGAWSRLFCGNLGIAFPQLKVLGSVMRTRPLAGAPEYAVAGSDFAFRKRLDGGYTIAQKNANIAHIVPDSFRLLFRFLPAFRSEGNDIRLRFGQPFFDELRTLKRWGLDQNSPFEQQRVLDPKPSTKILAQGLRNLIRSFPIFGDAEVVEQWGCAIDVTPDAIPVVSPVDRIPGLFIASGFSGHGFGVGPAAGRLMADLISGQAPIVDPQPYRLTRLNPNRFKDPNAQPTRPRRADFS